jgi:glycosyltransferase involved in cell wall biosynthesis
MKISCIVPAYNEGKRVGQVLDVLTGHPLIDELIVVNDGSKDDTEAVLQKRSGIDLISYPDNHGKTHALVLGFNRARNDMVMLIDSDLVGLTRADITALIEPIVSGQADVSMSLRENSLFIFKLFGLDFVSGERVFPKSVLGDLDKLNNIPGFGFETYLNQIMVQKKMRLRVVKWKNVGHTRKRHKTSYWQGQKEDFKMMMKVFSVAGGHKLFKLFWGMYRLKV